MFRTATIELLCTSVSIYIYIYSEDDIKTMIIWSLVFVDMNVTRPIAFVCHYKPFQRHICVSLICVVANSGSYVGYG
jgi:hypothetical protein